MNADPQLRSAAAVSSALVRGEFSVRQFVEESLARVAAREPSIHAFLSLDSVAIRARADELDAARARGEPCGPLFGVPVALKDNLCMKGTVTTAGSRILEGWRAPYDAHVVSRLLDAGAVPFGKTNLDEFAMGSSCENSAYGPTRNPWDEARVPGGSSGGSAAAVAAGFVPLALGSDTGGSIRQPAAFCGVVGFKPTYGRVSRRGLIAFASSLDQIGPFARSVADVRLADSVLAGHDPLDATSRRDTASLRKTLPHAKSALEGLRIGIHPDYVASLPAGATREAVTRTLDASFARGAVAVDLADLDLLTADALSIYYVIATAEASSNLARFDGMRFGPRVDAHDLISTYAATRGALFGSEVERRIVLGTFGLSAGYADEWYRRACERREALRAAYAAAFRRADVILGAVTPETAFRLGERSSDPLLMYLSDTLTVPASLAGLPSASVPIALDAAQLPIGLQVIGSEGADALVLDVAEAIESGAGFPSAAAAGGTR